MPTSGPGRLEIDDREELTTSAHLKQTPKHFWPVETRAHERAAEGVPARGATKACKGREEEEEGEERYLRSKTHKTRGVLPNTEQK